MKILNYGSLNIDYVYTLDHFVEPGETTASIKMEKFCGGKGLNQSIALAKAGASVYHAGCVGNDGAFLLDELKNNGVNTDYTSTTDSANGHAIIQVDKKGQNCIILYAGSNHLIKEKEIDETLSYFEKGDILLLQNEINNLKYIIDKAYEKGLSIYLNPSPINDCIFDVDLNKISCFILNEIEGKELSGEENPELIVKALHEKYNHATVVLTLGKDGVMFYDGENTFTNGIYNVKVVDTTAAGDTFTGYFIASVAKGESHQTALEIASKASSIAVSKNGAATSIPLLDEVLNYKF